MVEGKARRDWDHTAALMSLLANINRDPKKTRAFKPADFHPFTPRGPRHKVTMKEAKSMIEAWINSSQGRQS
jgi:hypothetical protein